MFNIFRRVAAAAVAATTFIASCGLVARADYPIFCQRYTADPTVIEYDGRVYIYASHDVYDPDNPTYLMKDITCISSDDMKNWTDHGEVFSADDTKWAGLTWAPSVIQRDDKFYLYFGNAGAGIGVAVSDSPIGPFEDLLGEPLITVNTAGIDSDPSSFWCFDPCVFIDDDGQAYVYFGGNGEGNSYVIKLADDMIHTVGEAVKIPAPHFFEASFMHKRNGKYYFSYSADFYKGLPSIEYMMSDNPMTGFEYKGDVIPNPPENYDNNHHSIFEFKGTWYAAYHNKSLAIANGYENGSPAVMFQRSICVDKLEYNADGTIKPIEFTKNGVEQLKSVDPYVRNEAETMAISSGVNTISNDSRRVVNEIDDSDWIKIAGVDFGADGAAAFKAGVGCEEAGGEIEIRLDSETGTLIGTLPVPYMAGDFSINEKLISVSGAVGKHDVYLVFKGDEYKTLFNFDYWQFEKKTTKKDLIGINAVADRSKFNKAEKTKITVTAVYSDGTTEDITTQSQITAEQNGIISIDNGTITGIEYGEVRVNVSYNGKTDAIGINVKDIDTEMTAKAITIDNPNISMINGCTEKYKITVEYLDGHKATVTDQTTVTNSNPSVAVIEKGIITAKSQGTTTAVLSYKGEKGNAVTTELIVTVNNNNPYISNRAAEFQEQSGVQIEDCSEGGKSIGYIENGDWIKFNSVDFGEGAELFETRYSSETAGGKIEIHLDSLDSKTAATLNLSGTGNWQNWSTASCAVSGISGIHDMYLKFTGGEGYLFNLSQWRFRQDTTTLTTAKSGGNPIVNTDFYADPSCRVFNDKMYVYGSHDRDNSDWYDMRDYHVWSSEDGVTWTDHGLALDKSDVPWASQDTNTIWAPDCVYKNGKYYLFFPSKDKNGTDRIGIATSSTPEGPFTAEENFIDSRVVGIDPCVYIDDETGEAYMYWSSNGIPYNILVAKLSDDLLSLETEPSVISIDGIKEYQLIEGPWVHKYNGNLYMTFPVCYIGNYAQDMEYAMATSPMGPFTYKGHVLDANGIYTIHGSVTNFKDKWYIFYHDAGINGNVYGRQWCAEEFTYNEDGTIPKIEKTLRGIGTVSAYDKVQVDRYNTCSEGIVSGVIKDDAPKEWEWAITYISDGSYVRYNNVDFGETAPKSVSLRIAALYGGGVIEIRNGADELLAIVPVQETGSWDVYQTITANLHSAPTGVHDLKLVFRNAGFNVNWIQFNSNAVAADHTLVEIDAVADNAKLDLVDGKNTATIKVNALYADGVSEDITSDAVISADPEGIVKISGNTIKAESYGNTVVNVSYNGKTDKIPILVKDVNTEVTAKSLTANVSEVALMNGASAEYVLTAEFEDGHTEDVTNQAKCVISNSQIASVKNGVITAKAKGMTTAKFSYRGQLGDAVSTTITITVSNTNPYETNDAASCSIHRGVQIEPCNEGGKSVGFIENGDWIMFMNVDFTEGASALEARVSSETNGGSIEVRIDDPEGALLGTVAVNGTGSWTEWTNVSGPLRTVTGVHDLYLRFVGGSGYLFNLSKWRIIPSTDPGHGLTIKAPVLNEDGNGAYIIASNAAANDVVLNIFTAEYETNGVLKKVTPMTTTVKSGAENMRIDIAATAGASVFVWDDNAKPYIAKTVLTGK